MFGYVKPWVPSLSVAEYEAYRGTYCGLCRTMGHVTGQVSRISLNYDFAFLAVFRMAVLHVPSEFERRCCPAHPFAKRTVAKPNEAFEFCAAASAVLTEGKIRDNVSDETGMKKLCMKAVSPIAASFVKRGAGTAEKIKESVSVHLEKLSLIEKDKIASIDVPAAEFGELLGDIASSDAEGNDSLVAREIGRSLGKIIYVLDAADDLEDDVKGEKYNPIALSYNDPLGESSENKRLLKKEIADELFTAIGIESNKAAASFELIDERGIETYKGIIMNTLTLGLRAEANRVLYGTGSRSDPFKFKL